MGAVSVIIVGNCNCNQPTIATGYISETLCFYSKGPVKLIKLVKNSSFILTICVKSVPRYNFKLAYVVLQMGVFENRF